MTYSLLGVSANFPKSSKINDCVSTNSFTHHFVECSYMLCHAQLFTDCIPIVSHFPQVRTRWPPAAGQAGPGLHKFLSWKVAAMNFHGVFMCIFAAGGETHPAESWERRYGPCTALGSAWVCDGLWSVKGYIFVLDSLWITQNHPLLYPRFRRWYGRRFNMFQPSWMPQYLSRSKALSRKKQIRKRARFHQVHGVYGPKKIPNNAHL